MDRLIRTHPKNPFRRGGSEFRAAGLRRGRKISRYSSFVVGAGLVIGLWPPLVAAQAPRPEIQLVGPRGLVKLGQVFTVEVRLNSQGQSVNAADLFIAYPADSLEVLRVGREQSIFTLWPEEPQWTNPVGTMTLVAGRPGGIYAVDATVATLYFRARQSGHVVFMLDLDRSRVYRHDEAASPLSVGSAPLELDLASDFVTGIPLESTTHPDPRTWSTGQAVEVHWAVAAETEYSYVFDSDMTGVPDDVPESQIGQRSYPALADGVYYFSIKRRTSGGLWTDLTQRRFLLDSTPPTAFSLRLLDPDTVGQQAVLAWQVSDAMSGVEAQLLTVNRQPAGRVASPLRIRPEWQDQTITITAVDGAGNMRVASWLPPRRGPAFFSVAIWITGLAAIMAAAGWFIVRVARRSSP
ncbi:MAG: hypothetical protein HYY50_04505 [Candidatus Kerfeldbacteria bacterium]|nr:hypothetical protein [Candidatus Kerfeldbacteria bacterium]